MSTVTHTPDDLLAGRKYKFHHDAGHGWLEVNYTDLVELNITHKITYYSYRNGDKAYLEEDWDLSTFLSAYEERFGVSITMGNLTDTVYDGYDSPIRGYTSYWPS